MAPVPSARLINKNNLSHGVVYNNQDDFNIYKLHKKWLITTFGVFKLKAHFHMCTAGRIMHKHGGEKLLYDSVVVL